MRLFKFFTTVSEIPDTYFLEETININSFISESTNTLDIFFVYIFYTDIMICYGYGSDTLSETLVFADSTLMVYNTELVGGFFISDNMYQPDYAILGDTFNLFDVISNKVVVSISLEENIGYVETTNSYVYIHSGYRVTWRTRTQYLNHGYGTTLYGDAVSYGDGAANGLAFFKVEVYNGITDTLLRTETITISDTSTPDTYAAYDYTYANNITDNTTFNPNLIFKVYSIDITGRVSPCRLINLEPIDLR